MHEHVRDYLANDDVARAHANGAFKVEPIRQMFRAKAGELVEGFYQIACDDDAIVVSILVAYPDNGIRFIGRAQRPNDVGIAQQQDGCKVESFFARDEVLAEKPCRMQEVFVGHAVPRVSGSFSRGHRSDGGKQIHAQITCFHIREHPLLGVDVLLAYAQSRKLAFGAHDNVGVLDALEYPPFVSVDRRTGRNPYPNKRRALENDVFELKGGRRVENVRIVNHVGHVPFHGHDILFGDSDCVSIVFYSQVDAAPEAVRERADGLERVSSNRVSAAFELDGGGLSGCEVAAQFCFVHGRPFRVIQRKLSITTFGAIWRDLARFGAIWRFSISRFRLPGWRIILGRGSSPPEPRQLPTKTRSDDGFGRENPLRTSA